MDTNEKRTVPVAYVTKWATTRGIVIVRNTRRAINNPDRLWLNYITIGPDEWTEDRIVAEDRWRKTMTKAADAAQKKADRLRAALALPPKYDTKAGA